MNPALQSITENVSTALPRSDLASILVSPTIQRSQQAFRAALPGLLKTKMADQQWVAFFGDELVTFGRTKTEAYQECLRRGMVRGTFVVRSIEPAALCDDVEILSRPDGCRFSKKRKP